MPPEDTSASPSTPKRALTRTYYVRFVAISSLFLLLIGVSWLALEYHHYTDHAEQARSDFLEKKRQDLRARTAEAMAYIQFKRARINNQLKAQARRRVQEAHATIEALHAYHGGGNEAARIVERTLRSLSFANDLDDVFAFDTDFVIRVAPSLQQHLGENAIDLMRASGSTLTREDFERIQEDGEGFLEYTFSKPGAEQGEYHKVSFIKLFKPMGWYIGTGVYDSDLARTVQQEVLDWLAENKPGTKEYYFAGTYDGVSLLGPAKGRNMWGITDANGVFIVRDLVAAAKHGGGFVSYVIPSMDGGISHPKLSYSMGVDEWGWYVGSGVGIDDIEREADHLRESFIARFRNICVGILAVLIVFLAASAMAIRSLSRRMNADFASFRNFFGTAAEQARPIDRSGLNLEEFDALAEAANRMISKREEAEIALRRSEARYRTIFENISDGYYRADMDGRLIMASPSALRMLAYANFREVAGENLAEKFYKNPEDRERFLEIITREGRVENHATTLKRKDGGTVEVETNAHIFFDDDTGEPLGVEGIFRDVTERKRTQELLVQTEKMMSVGGLAAGMAHEINNPLGGILQSVQNIIRRLDASLPANHEAAKRSGCDLKSIETYMENRSILRMIHGIKESGLRAATIVQNMLSFSRKSESRRAPCALNVLADRVVELASADYDLKRKFDFRKIDIRREYDTALPEVYVTITEIEQVVLNLLRNAAQAMAEQPMADTRPRITIRTRTESGHAILAVTDNGPGMAEETRRRVFEPFFTTKPPGRGTGLGLSVSYFIITQNHGGEFHVESEPGKGTTFSIHLPLD